MIPQCTTKSALIITTFLLIVILSIQHYHQHPQNTSKMSHIDQDISNIEPYKHLHIIRNTDGTITRQDEFYPTVPPTPTNDSLSKDVPLNPGKKTWVRLFLPRTTPDETPSAKLPIIIYAHGGGFILYSAASKVFHDFCSAAARDLNALVVSVEYRLAPEHRLPAAYDDVLDVLHWVKEGKDEWVKSHGNLSNCVLMGPSAGANIVYQAGLTALDQVNELHPLIITGMILIQPFFGGVKRTQSELRLVNDPSIPLAVNDLMWDLALPVGADRGHKYCDPNSGTRLGRVNESGWPVAVVGCDGDPLMDRQVEFVKLLEKQIVNVKSMFSEGGHHGVFSSDSTQRNKLFAFVLDFFN